MANPRAAIAITPGIVFRPNTGHGNQTHPYAVVAVSGGVAFTVNWTDLRHYEESTCRLDPGDHRQVIKPSVMLYPRFNELPVAVLAKQLAMEEDQAQLLRLDDLRPEILAKIIEGARRCPDLPNALKARYGLMPPSAAMVK